VHRETGDQTEQESRSTGHRAATSVTVMDIIIHATFPAHHDPDAALACHRGIPGQPDLRISRLPVHL
jgi:hypothetical protein